ncbi:MAG: DUF4962 domain-containing protein [Candidatus Hydrogenedentes bacterium]|nr:DUF4962 domain-containing protein [Candidatus Hydrogenedentota bacterium]
MFKTWLVACGCAAAALAAPGLELDESAAGTGEWGYRPESGTAPAVNPPGFSWRPCKDAVGYHLQVAPDEAFERIAYEKPDIQWSAHCPPVTFPAGEYFWRYAALDGNGEKTTWSVARRFTVSSGAALFPQPTTPELITRMPQDHPRLFFRPEELPKLRELAAGPLAEQFAELVRTADKLLENPPDTTEPPLYPKGTVRLSDEWRAIWWGNRTHVIKVADSAATLAFVYRMTGDERYGAAARDLLLAFAKWDPKGSTNYRHNDEAAMPSLYLPSRAYSWVRPMLSPEDRKSIAEVMRVRGRDCFDSLQGGPHLWKPYNSHHNRAWHKLGELAMAFHGEIEEADDWLDFAMTVMFTTYPVWSDDDGGWHEGMAYWSSYLAKFTYWADIVRSAFDINAYQMPFFSRAGDFGLYLLPPGTQHGGFGDLASTTKSENIAGLMAVLAAGAGNPYWKWHADTHGAEIGGGYAGFLRRARSMDNMAAPPSALPASARFRGVGLAVLNTNLVDGRDNIQLHFKSSPFFGRHSHGYNANNAFLLNVDGEPVFCPTGRRDVHGSPHHTNWMWDSRSDNAILVNGTGQKKHSQDARGALAAFHTSEHLDAVSGEAGASYENLDGWRRRIIFFKPHGFLIHDTLCATEASSFQWCLHAKGPMTLGEGKVLWEGKPGHVEVDFAYPAGLALSQTDQFDPPPAASRKWDLNEWHLTAETAEKAARQEFVVFIAVKGAQAGIDRGNSTLPRDVVINLPEGSARVELGDDTFTVNMPDGERHEYAESVPAL